MCVAVDEGGVSVRFDGSTWRALATPADLSMGNTSDIACPSTTFCAALLSGGVVATFNGATWNRAAQETGVYDPLDTAYGVSQLECATAYACTVAGRVKAVTSH